MDKFQNPVPAASFVLIEPFSNIFSTLCAPVFLHNNFFSVAISFFVAAKIGSVFSGPKFSNGRFDKAASSRKLILPLQETGRFAGH